PAHQSSMGNASSSNIPCSSRRRSVFHSKPTGIVSQLHLTCTNLIASRKSQDKSESPTPRPSTTFQYKLTWTLDSLRRNDFARLDRNGETYVDYYGRLIKAHTDFLHRSILGNTHSVSNSSKLSAEYAHEARAEVLRFFNASKDYTVIFTANTSAALKLVGESFPFAAGSSYLHGIREYALDKGASVCYIPSTPSGGLNLSTAKNVLLRNRPQSPVLVPSLFALTGQSNISNCKNPLSIAAYATSMGYYTIVDAAGPLGALVVKKSFLAQLKRPWFAGGTVDLVQVPGTIVTRAHEPHERFEDGTINYLSLPAITEGLRFLSAYLPFLPLRLSCLLNYLINSLSDLRHDTTGNPVVRILSRLPEKRVTAIGEQSETGSTVSLLFLDPDGEILPLSFIEHSASQRCISLRTGCVCNPGGAAALLDLQDVMARFYAGVTLSEVERNVGREIGVVRISLGLANNFQDVWQVVQYARAWNQWRALTGGSHVSH
ncbi:pyridoxal phosphate-dependent transferase, partial [Amanita rubescens]